MKKLLLKTWLVMLCMVAGVETSWAGADYTLSPTAGTNNSYAGDCDVEIEGITWNVTGNATMIPWRIGGKSITKVDRTVYSKTAYASAVKKVDLTVGNAANITVNSLKLVYSTNSNFSSSSEISKEFAANSTISFEGEFPANAYYKFVFNVTVSGSSNKFVEFSKVEFYNDNGGSDTGGGSDEKTLVSIAASGTPADLWVGGAFSHEGVTITATWDDASTSDVTSSCTFSGYDMTTAGTQTVTATYKEKTCTYDVNVRTIANTQATAYTTAEAIALIDAGKNLSQEVYVKGTVSKVDSYNSTYGSITYWLDDNSFEIYGGLAQDGAKFSGKDDIQVDAEVVVLGIIKKYNSTYEMDKNSVLVSYTAPADAKETATISAAEAMNNLTVGEEDVYDVVYNGDGTLSIASSNESVATASIDGNTVTVTALAAGTTTITISAPATDNYYAAEYKYTLTVEKAPAVAELPFSFDGGKNAIANTDGMSQNGLGTDYSNSPKLKFDGTNDELVINFAGQAGVLKYVIKGNGFKGGTFEVKESANGTDYTTIKTYTELAQVNLKQVCSLSADTRYVKFFYTNKDEGNVALGDIEIYAGYARSVVKDSYGTICLPYAVTAPEGATFSSVENISETGVITLANVSSLEAGKPYIFEATADAIVCEYTGEAVAEPVADAYLTGVFEPTTATVGSYVLQDHDGVVAFYKVVTDTPTVGANRAYLTVESDARVLTFGGETAITEIENGKLKIADAIYNMAGQRVSKAQKGIFIINGKKVVK